MEKIVPVVAAVITTADRPQEVLIVRRGPDQSGAGFWEFPGGKIEPEEAPAAALIREIQEELGIDIEVGDLLGEQIFDYQEKVIRLTVFKARAANRDLVLSEHDDQKWVRPEHIDINTLSPADRPFVKMLMTLG